MGYLRNLSRRNFRVDNMNRTIYLPWGRIGRAYILPNDKYENKIRGVLAKIDGTMLALMIVLVGVGPVGFIIYFFPFYYLAKLFVVKHFIAGLQTASKKLTIQKYKEF